MKEDLKESQEVAHKMLRAVTIMRELCQEAIENHPKLNDETTLLIALLINGMNKIGKGFEELLDLIQDRKEIYGKTGIEKEVRIRLVDEDDPSVPDDDEYFTEPEEEDYDPDSYEED